MRAGPAAGALLALLALPALAQESEVVRLAQQRDRAAIDTLVLAETVAEARIRWLALFHADDLDDRPGLTGADRAIGARIRDARIRADRVIQQLRHDLGGDLAVARAEIPPFVRGRVMGPIPGGRGPLAPNAAQVAAMAAQMVAQMLSADVSGDGVLTMQEMLAEPLADYVALPELADPSRAPFAVLLDADGDGTVTEYEFLAPLTVAADRMDANGDGVLSLIEKGTFGACRPKTICARRCGHGRAAPTQLSRRATPSAR